ncbi:hypothetical protein VIGAN_02221100 [Vigna angularis var. angularis]|uniref:Uncharacterized protein n=1 Tax=Vigna angularis var. angularis TaxID=157739 RepID=A0A0S3RF85_PHAAN|nr:hypothetical protein VIGAN_02221100 [Vigna angularis var. angularis]
MCQRIRIGVLHFLSSSSICRVHSSSFQDTNRSLLISQTIVPFNISFSLHTLLPLLINTVLSMGAVRVKLPLLCLLDGSCHGRDHLFTLLASLSLGRDIYCTFFFPAETPCTSWP